MEDRFKDKYRIPSARLQDWDYGWNAAYFITICSKDRIHFFGEITEDEMQLHEIGLLAGKFWNEIPEHFPFTKICAFVVMPNHVHGILVLDKPSINNIEYDETRIIENETRIIENETGIIENETGIIENETGIIENETGIIENETGIIENETGIIENETGIIENETGIIENETGIIENETGIIENETRQCLVSTDGGKGKTPGQQRFRNQGRNTLSSIIGSYKSVVTKHARKINPDFAWQSRFHDHIIRDRNSFDRITEYILNNPSRWKDDMFFD